MTIQQTLRVQTPLVEENKSYVFNNVTETAEIENAEIYNSSLISPVSFEQTIEFSPQEVVSEVASVSVSTNSTVFQESPILLDAIITDEIEVDEAVVALNTEEKLAVEETITISESSEIETIAATSTVENVLTAEVALDKTAELKIEAVLTEENVTTTEVLEINDVIRFEAQEDPTENLTVISKVLLDTDSIPGLETQSEEAVDVSSGVSFIDTIWGFFYNPFASSVVEDANSTDTVA